MQSPRPHPRCTESETALQQDPQGILNACENMKRSVPDGAWRPCAFPEFIFVITLFLHDWLLPVETDLCPFPSQPSHVQLRGKVGKMTNLGECLEVWQDS